MNYKIKLSLHITYWLLYIALMALLLLVASLNLSSHQGLSYFISVGFLFVIVPSSLCFYASYHLLFQHYLQHRKLSLSLLYGLGMVLSSSVISSFIIMAFWGTDFMFKLGYSSFIEEFILISLFGCLNIITAFILRGFIAWYQDLKIKESLLTATHQMELDLIKAKLDPHFLFNTINNIDSLMLVDVEKASDYLVKLSSILRFMLYESATEQIPIGKELDYIRQYIELQRIRSSNRELVKYTEKGLEHQHQIAPLLFIPFIENAFKHLGSKKAIDAIDIRIELTKDTIHFFCKNNYSPSPLEQKKDGGIGNQLITKRLDLLYPDRYQLSRSTENGDYIIQLSIQNHAH